jgi:hypothetical protein
MHTTTDREEGRMDPRDPPILLAILIAARKTGDRLLETVARRELDEKHRIKIRFARDKRPVHAT